MSEAPTSDTVESGGADPAAFVVTKEHRRFAEFCEACRRYRYIGLCYGPPGVGKTLSARHYANWDKVERYELFAPAPPVPLSDVAGSRAVFYTPSVANTPGRVDREVKDLRIHLTEIAYAQRRFSRQGSSADDGASAEETAQQPSDLVPGSEPKQPVECDSCVSQAAEESQAEAGRRVEDPTELILVDEADRLRMPALEQLRDVFDRGRLGLVLIGMPGLERRLSRYPQLYSRVGFVHAYRPLGEAEMRFLLQQRWRQMGLRANEGDFTDTEAMAAVIRITGGNWRLLHRLMAQVERLLQINEFQTVTKEVIEAARENLIIGQT